MKTDLVLTMDEYLAMCCDIPKHVDPPARDARYIPITAKGDVELNTDAHGCRGDRWGHPCPGLCRVHRSTDAEASDFNAHEEMR